MNIFSLTPVCVGRQQYLVHPLMSTVVVLLPTRCTSSVLFVSRISGHVEQGQSDLLQTSGWRSFCFFYRRGSRVDVLPTWSVSKSRTVHVERLSCCCIQRRSPACHCMHCTSGLLLHWWELGLAVYFGFEQWTPDCPTCGCPVVLWISVVLPLIVSVLCHRYVNSSIE